MSPSFAINGLLSTDPLTGRIPRLFATKERSCEQAGRRQDSRAWGAVTMAAREPVTPVRLRFQPQEGGMNKPKVFVTRLIPAAGLEQVREYCNADIWTEPLPPSADVLRRKVSDCEGLLSLLTERIDGALLDAAPRLRVVSNYAVGFNNIDVPAATERGIAVGNTPGVLTDATADMAFALLICAARRIVPGHAYSLSGKWKTWEPLGHLGQDLAGRTLGIVGMGRIGFALAERCCGGWDMNILYHDVHVNQRAE